MQEKNESGTKPRKAGIIMGSDSDLYVMREAAAVLKELNIPFEMHIVSAHRTPDRMYSYARSAEQRGVAVLIAGAGGSAHLPGMIAALANIPVIGVPIRSRHLDGLDSLLSIVQMPDGIPVATVPINGGRVAGLLAARIMGLQDPHIQRQLLRLPDEVPGGGEVQT